MTKNSTPNQRHLFFKSKDTFYWKFKKIGATERTSPFWRGFGYASIPNGGTVDWAMLVSERVPAPKTQQRVETPLEIGQNCPKRRGCRLPTDLYRKSVFCSKNTPLKTNLEPENGPLEKEKHLQITSFWVPCLFSRGYSQSQTVH